MYWRMRTSLNERQMQQCGSVYGMPVRSRSKWFGREKGRLNNTRTNPIPNEKCNTAWPCEKTKVDHDHELRLVISRENLIVGRVSSKVCKKDDSRPEHFVLSG